MFSQFANTHHVIVPGGGGGEGDLGGQELQYCHWLCHTGELLILDENAGFHDGSNQEQVAPVFLLVYHIHAVHFL